jgi:hypothetical protein
MPEGIEAPEPPPLPEGEGMLGLLRPPPPELPPPEDPPPEDPPPLDPPEEPLEPGELGEGMEVDEDWLAQPPMRKAETVPTAASCAAMASARFHAF